MKAAEQGHGMPGAEEVYERNWIRVKQGKVGQE